MRARNIKPGFFKNEDLAECSMSARILFIGLWCLADREGRLEDRPKKIKMEVFPADSLDCEGLLVELVQRDLITRYEADGVNCIYIPKFVEHQKPHVRETASTLPAPKCEIDKERQVDGDWAQPRHDLGADEAQPGRPDFLNPESPLLNPESPLLNPPAPHGGATTETMTIRDIQGLYLRTFPVTIVPPINLERLRGWLKLYPPEQIRRAFEATAAGHGRTLDYTEAILKKGGSDEPRSPHPAKEGRGKAGGFRDTPKAGTDYGESIIPEY